MLSSKLRAFQDTIATARIRIGRVPFEWYPYDTLANVSHLERLLSQDLESFLNSVCPNGRILDAGCGDGELAFFLESLGFNVVAIDHPMYNHSGMQGVRALRAQLGSSLEIHEVDLDRPLRLPHESYDAVLLLGVLYHLRNPFLLLEELAKRSSHCLLSTRVARRFPDGGRMPKDVALAYLLSRHELNQDKSNYFIFSEAGLRVLVERSYWNIRNVESIGDASRSDPLRHDERIFCLLESSYGRPLNIELGDGWHEAEESGWRWTRQEFTLMARMGKGSAKRTLAMEFFIPAELLSGFPALELGIDANGVSLAPAVFDKPGMHHIVRQFDSAGSDETRIRFRLSRALAGDDRDARERGIVVEAVKVE
jgi:tRNA (mo5U34)-methyltransferase